jgi:hypothetical protein
MSTVRDLIFDALKKIHVVGVGQNLTDEQAQSAFRSLNDLLDSWSVEGGLVFTHTQETFPLVNGKQTYTIGSGGDFDTVKPFLIKSAYTTIGTTDYHVDAYAETEWAKITNKVTSSGIPEIYYYDNNDPLATMYLYPIPTSVSTITLFTRKPIAAFASINDTVDLPEGYRRALVYNLAMEEAPSYEKEPAPTVVKIANQAKSSIFSYNSRNNKVRSQMDSALMYTEGETFDVYTGQNL